MRSHQEERWICYSLNLAQFVGLEQYFSEFRRYSLILLARLCSDAD
jgi:ArsR family transcriptional regulator, arsenate/arsenite/antimonite-responsive transcriptional repressor